MTGVLESLTETYAAVPGSLFPARRAVTDLALAAGATGEQADAIRLATSEAVTNVIVHAYGDRPGDIYLTAAVAGGELWLLVADDGDGFRQGGDKSGLGLGLTLIAQACDELTIVNRSSGGTELRMRFQVGVAGAAPALASDHPRGSVASASWPAASVFSTTK